MAGDDTDFNPFLNQSVSGTHTSIFKYTLEIPDFGKRVKTLRESQKDSNSILYSEVLNAQDIDKTSTYGNVKVNIFVEENYDRILLSAVPQESESRITQMSLTKATRKLGPKDSHREINPNLTGIFRMYDIDEKIEKPLFIVCADLRRNPCPEGTLFFELEIKCSPQTLPEMPSKSLNPENTGAARMLFDASFCSAERTVSSFRSEMSFPFAKRLGERRSGVVIIALCKL